MKGLELSLRSDDPPEARSRSVNVEILNKIIKLFNWFAIIE